MAILQVLFSISISSNFYVTQKGVPSKSLSLKHRDFDHGQ